MTYICILYCTYIFEGKTKIIVVVTSLSPKTTKYEYYCVEKKYKQLFVVVVIQSIRICQEISIILTDSVFLNFQEEEISYIIYLISTF